MNPMHDATQTMLRRHFLAAGASALGGAALATLSGRPALASSQPASLRRQSWPHFAPTAKQVIYMHMVGGPSQIDLFEHKPAMRDFYDVDLPESVRKGQRLTTMTSGQARFPIAPSMYNFAQYGQSGMWISELLPHTAKMVDEMAFIRSMHTDAINHEPAITLMQSGNQIAGRPCMGSWAAYGLGSLNENLPTFAVMLAQSTNREQIQAISNRLWSSGYLPGEYAGVSLRTSGDPILFLDNPPGVSRQMRRTSLDGLSKLNQQMHERLGDPETLTRIQQYELAFRMQSSVPELTDLASEPASTFDLYGEEAKKPATFANSALMARRMVERGVRFVQIYHNNWDTHGNVAGRLPQQCQDVDQACAGLIKDLKQRGMLDETLLLWGGEFGRTIYSQGGLSKTNYGRDHHPKCYTMWMAGGGVKPGVVYGTTDEFCYNIVENPVHVRDLHATILHLLGFDHEHFTIKHQGLDQKLTGVLPAKVVHDLIA